MGLPAATGIMKGKSTSLITKQRLSTARDSKQHGFTLLELMITLAIMSIMVGISVVGYRSQMEVSQTSEVSSGLRMDLVFSRGEAIKRGGWVGLCGSENGTECSDNYDQGWIVFHDLDRDSDMNNADVVLSWNQQPHTAVDVTLTENGAGDGAIIFSYRGYPDRSVQLSATRGDSTEGFELLQSGRIEPL